MSSWIGINETRNAELSSNLNEIGVEFVCKTFGEYDGGEPIKRNENYVEKKGN